MDCSKILVKHYKGLAWICGDTYESMIWNDKSISKPSKEHLETLWNDVLKDEMRQERNQLLKDCDFRVLPDYPDTNKEAWVLFRQQLRDFPALWSEGMDFPIKPE